MIFTIEINRIGEGQFEGLVRSDAIQVIARTVAVNQESAALMLVGWLFANMPTDVIDAGKNNRALDIHHPAVRSQLGWMTASIRR